jgi:hypothetical protein
MLLAYGGLVHRGPHTWHDLALRHDHRGMIPQKWRIVTSHGIDRMSIPLLSLLKQVESRLALGVARISARVGAEADAHHIIFIDRSKSFDWGLL